MEVFHLHWAITWLIIDTDLWGQMASLGRNELNKMLMMTWRCKEPELQKPLIATWALIQYKDVILPV